MTIRSKRILEGQKSSNKRGHLHEGKTKILFDGVEPETMVLQFKESPDKNLNGAAAINNLVSEYFMGLLSDCGFDTHLIKRLNMREQLVRKVEPYPFSIRVSQVLPRPIQQLFAADNRSLASEPMIDFFMRNPQGEELSFINTRHLINLGFISPEELERLEHLAQRIYDFIGGHLRAVGFKLSNLNLEFGRFYFSEFSDAHQILLIDDLGLDHLDFEEALPSASETQNLEKERPLSLPAKLDLFKDLCHRLKIISS